MPTGCQRLLGFGWRSAHLRLLLGVYVLLCRAESVSGRHGLRHKLCSSTTNPALVCLQASSEGVRVSSSLPFSSWQTWCSAGCGGTAAIGPIPIFHCCCIILLSGHQQPNHCRSAQMVRETEMEPTKPAKGSTITRPGTSPASSNPPSSIPAWLLDRDQKPSPRGSSAVCGQDQCLPRSSARSRRTQGSASSLAAASSYHKLSLELIKSMSGTRALGLLQPLELVQRQIFLLLWQVAVAVWQCSGLYRPMQCCMSLSRCCCRSAQLYSADIEDGTFFCIQ